MGEEGREGDWECNRCNNRNYAFRSICNRCKHPRLLVDTQTPPSSSWLPRLGDWICSGCTNNNYASREKCKKCGQPKEVAAMPAFAMPGVFIPNQGGPNPNSGLGSFHHLIPRPPPTWPFTGSFPPHANSLDQLSTVPKGWRYGDWICTCGFHNYSSRAQCKQCNAAPPALGVKRLASDELVHEWESKRLNAGAGPVNHYMQPYSGFRQAAGFMCDQPSGLQSAYHGRSSTVATSMQVPMQLPQLLIGKGAKQWRDGDWMCTNCSNHNYASRSECNRCKIQKTQPVDVA